jgi:protein-S-isoprenylcysteine O-methyltransferase Ste14
MLKLLARAAGFLAYLFITLEMLLMVTPFALYYYSAYSPLLAGSFRFAALAWMPAFFLPHLSTEIIPSVGGLIFLLGLVGFLLCAFQLYYAKFRGRGVLQSFFYKRIRHPQYLFLAMAGLGLLIVWPRFILLIAYINMLWLYYLLARDEERRVEARYGNLYGEYRERTSMFLPGELGGALTSLLFGWARHRRVRLLVIYAFSLAGSLVAASALRGLSVRLTTHLVFPDRKIAAVSFLEGDRGKLRELVESVVATEEIQPRIKRENDWVLVQALDGNRPITHLMIDAGMTRRGVENLPLTEGGVKLVFSRCKCGGLQPLDARARWQPVFIAEMNARKISRVVDLDQKLFSGNPVPPVF